MGQTKDKHQTPTNRLKYYVRAVMGLRPIAKICSTKQIPRSAPLYKKTNWEGVKSYIRTILKKGGVQLFPGGGSNCLFPIETNKYIVIFQGGGSRPLSPPLDPHLERESHRSSNLLFEKSLSKGKIPSDWTKFKVSLAFRNGSKSRLANYMPLLTCILCKVMEHTIASKLTQHLNQHTIFFDLQHGVRERKTS